MFRIGEGRCAVPSAVQLEKDHMLESCLGLAGSTQALLPVKVSFGGKAKLLLLGCFFTHVGFKDITEFFHFEK